MTRRSTIGFDRRIDIEWLDAAAAQAAASTPATELRKYLWDLLEGVLTGDRSNSARGKTVTVLSHIWSDVPPVAVELHRRACAHLGTCKPDERLALHWAMMIGTYPVFTDVAAAAGRLLALQGSFTLSHLTRRLVGTWGERSTLARAAQRVVRSMVQWGVLEDTATRGMYRAAARRQTVGPAVGLLLVEALLIDAEESSIPLDQLVGHPSLFPFTVAVNAGHVRAAPQLQVHRHGLDTDIVELQSQRGDERSQTVGESKSRKRPDVAASARSDDG